MYYNRPPDGQLPPPGGQQQSTASSLVAHFPELGTLTVDELRELNSDQQALDDFVEELPVVKSLEKMSDELLHENRRLADSNYQLEPELAERKRNINQRLEHISDLRQRCDTLSAKHNSLAEVYAPTNIQDSLRIASAEAEQESERVATAFLNGQMDVDAFVKEYGRTRSLCHSRKVRHEKLHQQLKQLQRAGF